MSGYSPTAVVRILRSGIVPSQAIDDLSVGYSKLRSRIFKSLADLEGGSNAQPLFIDGEWGTGKSHSLNYCRSLSVASAIPAALISVNPRTVALNYPQRLFGEMAASIQLAGVLGLRAILHPILLDVNLRHRLRSRLASISASPSNSVLSALISFYDKNDALNPQVEMLWSFLLGEDLIWSDYTYKREQALQRIQLIAEILRTVNNVGMVLLFDEIETIDQLWNYKSRLVAYAVIARLAQIKGVWSVFAVTERFKRIIDADLPRADGQARWLISSLKNGNIEMVSTPPLNAADAWQLASTIAKIYREAYPVLNYSDSQIDDWVQEWNLNPARNPRRLIRSVVYQLDCLRPLA